VAARGELSEEETLTGKAATAVFVPHLLVMNDESGRKRERETKRFNYFYSLEPRGR
jgi:hypothetical protein